MYTSSTPPTLQTLLKTYSTGLSIVAFSSKYDSTIISSTLAGMQVTALQSARLGGEDEHVLKLWAAQTALWQLEYVNSENVNDKTRQRLGMLPRLAESLAEKYKDSSPEACLLYVETLKQQNKHAEIVEAFSQQKGRSTLTSQQQLELVASAFEKLEQWESARGVYERLLQEHADQWAYWKCLLESAYREGGMERAFHAVQDQLDKTMVESLKYPCRARNLILCELAAVRIRGGVENGANGADACSKEDLESLQSAIVDYGNAFGPRASCAYSDLVPYIELLVKASNDDQSLLEWANQFRLDNQSVTDRAMLRSYIFAIQVTYKVLSMLKTDSMNEKWLPEWEELVTQWRASQKLGTAKEGEDVRAQG